MTKIESFFIVTVFITLTVFLPFAHAADIYVNSFAQTSTDPTVCTLSQAIAAANGDSVVGGCSAGSGTDTIHLPAGIYELNSASNSSLGGTGLPPVTTEIEIIGSSGGSGTPTGPTRGADPANTVITRTGQNYFRLFSVSSSGNLTLIDLTLSNGYPAAPYTGGAIRVNLNGLLTLDHCIVTNNRAASGGGVDNFQGTVNIINDTILSNNEATTDDGGSIYNNGGQVLVIDSTITTSTAHNAGGGIYNTSAGNITLTRTIISSNQAGDGGGTYNANSSSLSARYCSFTDNSATDQGGGVDNTDGILSIFSSTFANNQAGSAGGGLVSGGLDDASTEIINSTVSGNSAGTMAGGIAVMGSFNAVNITITANTSTSSGGGVAISQSNAIFYNSIIAGNNSTNTNDNDYLGTINGDHNLIGGDPELGPLQDNGGPTLTHLPQNNSPAIDAGDSSRISGVSLDQRGNGYPRIVNGTVDIGACEVQIAPSVPTLGEWGAFLLVLLLATIAWRKQRDNFNSRL